MFNEVWSNAFPAVYRLWKVHTYICCWSPPASSTVLWLFCSGLMLWDPGSTYRRIFFTKNWSLADIKWQWLWPYPLVILKGTRDTKEVRAFWGVASRLTAIRLMLFVACNQLLSKQSSEFQQCYILGWKAFSACPTPTDIECCHVFPQRLEKWWAHRCAMPTLPGMLKRVQDHPKDSFEVGFSVGTYHAGVLKSITLLTGIQLFNFVLFLHPLQAQTRCLHI